MTCEQVQFELKAYLDGELGLLARRSVARHLADCEICRAERDALWEVSAELRETESFELPEAFRARLVALAPQPATSIPPRRMPTLAWSAVGGVCLATLAAIYFKPVGATPTEREAAPSFAAAPAAPRTETAAKGDVSGAVEERDNRAAPKMEKPAQTIGAVAPQDGAMSDSANIRIDPEPAKKSRGRRALPISSTVEFALVAFEDGTTDAELVAAAKAQGGKVVSKQPLLLEIAPEKLAAFQQWLVDRSQKSERAKRGMRSVKVRLRPSARIRP